MFFKWIYILPSHCPIWMIIFSLQYQSLKCHMWVFSLVLLSDILQKHYDSLDRILSTTIYVIIFFLRTHPPLVELYLVLFFYAPHCLLDPLICKNPPQVQENWRQFQIEWHTAISQITHCSGLSLSSLTFPFWSWDSSSHIWDLYLLDIKNFDSIWAKVNSDQASNWKWLWVLHCEELRENHVEMVWKQRKIIWLAVT